ncbi:MAG TPA: protein translocase SEC61 complex subunit gamma [Candidatus Nanoarchaeia archaeon]|nr:protein translocase SEC61 complex subunit gamma [Candidatus Nanoarchaeia archaeon]
MEVVQRLKSFFVQCTRVWHLLKKPSKEEFVMVAKISALGILALGAAGFIISDSIKLLTKLN